MALALTTLGSMEARLVHPDGRLLHRWGPGKPSALLLYLASSPRRTATREQLTDLLWADSPPERARATLRQTLSQLRHHLGPDGLSADDEVVTLRTPADIDRDRFIAAVERDDPIAATELYQGEFLPTFSVPGGLEFEHWADTERARMELAWERIAPAAVMRLLDAGRFRDAALLARRLRESNPNRESAWRPLIEALVAGGDSAGARLEADAMLARLKTDGREPSRHATEWLARIFSRNAAEPTAGEERVTTLDPELVGREVPFAKLMDAWSRARTGRLQHIHVAGQPGIGKSRLLGDAADRFRAGGVGVVRRAARWPERRIPYALVADLVRALVDLPGARGVAPDAVGPLLALDPSLSATLPGAPDRAVDGEALRRRALAVADLLRAAADERPFVLMVDDLQWADAESLDVLAIAAARSQASSILIVTAARPPFAWATDLESSARIELEPLTAEQIESLLASIADLPAEEWSRPWCDGVATSSGGIPLLVLEQLESAINGQLVRLESGRWTITDPSRLGELTDAVGIIRRRIESLAPGPRRVLSLLALAGEPVADPAITEVAGEAPEGHLRILEQRRFVRRTGATWETTHALIGSEALAALPEGERLRLSTRLAAWHGQSSDPDDLRRAARYSMATGDVTTVPTLFRRFRAARRAADRRDPIAQDLEEFLEGTGDEAIRRQCRSALPWRSRSEGARRGGVVTGVAIVVLAAGGVWWWLGLPTRLEVVVQPLSIRPLVPAPVVEVRDRLGRRVAGAAIPVTIGVDSGGGPVQGTTTVISVDGRAKFDGVTTAELGGRHHFIFSAPGLTGAHSALTVHNGDVRLWLIRGTVSGQTVTPAQRTVTASPSDSIAGQVEFDFTSPWPAASVMLGMTPSWGNPATAYQTLGPLPTPTEHARQTFTFGVRAPKRPGRYALVFAFGAEPDVGWIMSATNWSAGKMIWDDGNELAGLDDRLLRQADTAGFLQVWSWVRKDHPGGGAPVGLTTLQLVVR